MSQADEEKFIKDAAEAFQKIMEETAAKSKEQLEEELKEAAAAMKAANPSFFSRHKKKIIIGTSVVAGALGGYFGWKYLKTKTIVETV